MTDNLFLILWNVFDLTALHYFMRKMYGPVAKWYSVYWVAMALLPFGTSLFEQSGNGFYSIIFISVCSLCLLPFFKTDRLRQILYSACLMTVTLTLNLLTTELLYLSSSHLALTPWSANLCMHVSLWLLILLVVRLVGPFPGAQIPKPLWVAFMAIPIAGICVIFMNIVLLTVVQDNNPEMYTLASMQVTLSCFVFLFLNILTFYIYAQVSKLKETIENNTLLGRQISDQARYYEEVHRMQNTIRSLHHDMKNHLSLLSHLLSEKKLSEAEKLLSSLEASAHNVSPVIVTGNEPIDAMLDIKLAELRASGIRTHLNISIPQGLRMSFAQAATIFGNLLDNVHEACLLLPENRREMSLNMIYINDILYFTLSNSCASGREADKGLETRKSDKLMHGIGLKNVDRYVRELGGTMEHVYRTSCFTVKIVLYHMGSKIKQGNDTSVWEQDKPSAKGE